jgi:polyisoprenoid-binding protein YceI
MRLRTLSAVAGLIAVLGFSNAAVAQTRFVSQPGVGSIKIEGTSTTHDWEMEGKLIGGKMEFGQGVKLDPAQMTIPGLSGDTVPVKLNVIIPVRSMHSKADHMPDVMDHLMQEHLKEDQFPRIEYKLTEMKFKGPHEAGKPFNFDTTGELSIAGVTNKVSFPVTIEALEAGKLRVQGTAPLKMTDFKVDPPEPKVAGLGLMRCEDAIKIIIDWTLQERK